MVSLATSACGCEGESDMNPALKPDNLHYNKPLAAMGVGGSRFSERFFVRWAGSRGLVVGLRVTRLQEGLSTGQASTHFFGGGA